MAMPDEEYRHLHDELAIHHPERLAEVDAAVARILTECDLCESEPKTKVKKPSKPLPKKEAKEEELTDIVYCRRHKHTKPVPKGWANTCTYLCHKCYRLLSPEARKEYASRDAFRKPLKAKALLHKQLEKKPEPVLPQLPPSRQVVPAASFDDIPAAASPYLGDAFRDVMPQYSIKCLRCRKTSPCHHHWFSQSRVLCPTCYSSMNQADIDAFHRQNGNDDLPIPPLKPSRPKPIAPPPPKPKVEKPSYRPTYDFFSHEDSVLVSRRYSDEAIRRMTRKQLAEAVRQGYVSRPRARIELHRRQAEDYYHMLPDVPGVVV